MPKIWRKEVKAGGRGRGKIVCVRVNREILSTTKKNRLTRKGQGRRELRRGNSRKMSTCSELDSRKTPTGRSSHFLGRGGGKFGS